MGKQSALERFRSWVRRANSDSDSEAGKPRKPEKKRSSRVKSSPSCAEAQPLSIKARSGAEALRRGTSLKVGHLPGSQLQPGAAPAPGSPRLPAAGSSTGPAWALAARTADSDPAAGRLPWIMQRQGELPAPARAGAPRAQKGRAKMDTKEFFTEYGEANRYTIKEVIGKGSYGVVCSAVDTKTGEKVAIKKINNVFDHVSDATRILREIKLLRLLRHPGAARAGPPSVLAVLTVPADQEPHAPAHAPAHEARAARRLTPPLCAADIVEIKHVMLPPSPREFRDIFVVFELMETDLHQARARMRGACRPSHSCARGLLSSPLPRRSSRQTMT